MGALARRPPPSCGSLPTGSLACLRALAPQRPSVQSTPRRATSSEKVAPCAIRSCIARAVRQAK
eukprot:872112-Pyramimonas_sp.AAC.1